MVKKINIGKAFKSLGKSIQKTAVSAINEVKKVEKPLVKAGDTTFSGIKTAAVVSVAALQNVEKPLVYAGETTFSGIKTAAVVSVAALQNVEKPIVSTLQSAGYSSLGGLKTIGDKIESGITKELPAGLILATDSVFDGLYTVMPDMAFLDGNKASNEKTGDEINMTFVLFIGVAVSAYLLFRKK